MFHTWGYFVVDESYPSVTFLEWNLFFVFLEDCEWLQKPIFCFFFFPALIQCLSLTNEPVLHPRFLLVFVVCEELALHFRNFSSFFVPPHHISQCRVFQHNNLCHSKLVGIFNEAMPLALDHLEDVYWVEEDFTLLGHIGHLRNFGEPPIHFSS